MIEIQQPEMFFYQLTLETDDPKLMGYVGRGDIDPDTSQLGEGKLVEDWPDGVTIFVEGEEKSDFMIVAPDWRIISDQLRRSLDEFEIDGVQYLPVQIIHKKTGAEIGTYWTINVIKTVEALDWDRTRWKEQSKIEEKFPRDVYPLLYILEIALRSEAVNGIDCFRLSVNGHIHGGLFISHRMKEYIEQQDSNAGLYFIKVPVY